MIGDQLPSRIWGIWVRSNKTFYWLETGPTTIRFVSDKIRSILMSRDILRYNVRVKLNKGEEPCLDMSMEDAQEKGYLVERLFINDHVAASTLEAEKNKGKAQKNPWG